MQAALSAYAQIPIRSKDELGELAQDFNEMTRELKTQRERIVKAEKDAAWREMARQIAHDLKNPLTPIKLSLDLLERVRREDPENAERILERTMELIRRQVTNLQHIAGEFCGRLSRERPALPAIALTANTSDLTALGNDYGFERVFARLVEAHGRPGDVAIAISTSGNSPNVLAAVDTARDVGLRTIAFTGRGGGKLATRVELALVVPSDDTQRIQESHIAIGHALAELVDDALYPRS